MRKQLAIYLFLLILLAVNSNAFLISPPKIEIQYQPSFTQQYEIILYNNRQENINLETYVKYDYLSESVKTALSGSVVLSMPSISFTPSDTSKSFTATITLPSSLEQGTFDIRIGAVEEAVSGVVGSRSANEVRLLILNGGVLSTTSIKREEQPRETQLPPSGPGEQLPILPDQVVPARSQFVLQVVTTFVTSILFLIFLVLFYLLMKRRKQELAIVSLEIDSKGSSAKIEAVVRNKSLEMLDDVYIDFQIIDRDANIIKTINIGPIKLKPASEGVVTRIWDAAGIKKDSYTVRMLLYHHKHASVKQKQFILQ